MRTRAVRLNVLFRYTFSPNLLIARADQNEKFPISQEELDTDFLSKINQKVLVFGLPITNYAR
jgi:hypothetical protein